MSEATDRARQVLDNGEGWGDTNAYVGALRSALHELLAELERVEGAAKTLGKIVDSQCMSVLAAIGEELGGDLIDEDGDGDWMLVWERLAELGERVDALRSQLGIESRSRDEWESNAEDAETRADEAETVVEQVKQWRALHAICLTERAYRELNDILYPGGGAQQ